MMALGLVGDPQELTASDDADGGSGSGATLPDSSPWECEERTCMDSIST